MEWCCCNNDQEFEVGARKVQIVASEVIHPPSPTPNPAHVWTLTTNLEFWFWGAEISGRGCAGPPVATSGAGGFGGHSGLCQCTRRGADGLSGGRVHLLQQINKQTSCEEIYQQSIVIWRLGGFQKNPLFLLNCGADNRREGLKTKTTLATSEICQLSAKSDKLQIFTLFRGRSPEEGQLGYFIKEQKRVK